MRKTRTTIAVIGEGPTEKYYLKSLEGVIHAQVKPVVPNHATSMAELERRIEQCIDDGYNMIFCLIDMDNKKEGRNRENYLRLKTKYHQKTIIKKRQGTESLIRFFENERCLEIWFLYHFKYTTQQFNSSNELAKELEHICNYEKTEDFFSRKCKGLHNFLLALKSATKLFSVLLASKRPLITELADKLRLKYPLLPTISPCPTMRLEAIRSIIPISCRRYPKSV
ncbi:hypothetical protein HMPREF1205_02060 [Bacteroides fragilis HMW 616]|nr:hypothetical protein HMPREF1205_02060 [Bacteroides fragilis HMW 616]